MAGFAGTRQPRPAANGFILRYLADPIVKRALRDHYADLVRMEDVLRASDLDWTIVRPPRLTSMLSILDQPRTFRQTIGIAN
jgi:NAD(P)H-binding